MAGVEGFNTNCEPLDLCFQIEFYSVTGAIFQQVVLLIRRIIVVDLALSSSLPWLDGVGIPVEKTRINQGVSGQYVGRKSEQFAPSHDADFCPLEISVAYVYGAESEPYQIEFQHVLKFRIKSRQVQKALETARLKSAFDADFCTPGRFGSGIWVGQNEKSGIGKNVPFSYGGIAIALSPGCAHKGFWTQLIVQAGPKYGLGLLFFRWRNGTQQITESRIEQHIVFVPETYGGVKTLAEFFVELHIAGQISGSKSRVAVEFCRHAVPSADEAGSEYHVQVGKLALKLVFAVNDERGVGLIGAVVHEVVVVHCKKAPQIAMAVAFFVKISQVGVNVVPEPFSRTDGRGCALEAVGGRFPIEKATALAAVEVAVDAGAQAVGESVPGGKIETTIAVVSVFVKALFILVKTA